MKIKQIGEYRGDIISTILENRKIEDVELLLNPNNNDDTNSFNLANMKLGAEVLIAHLAVNSDIALLVDPDADGFTSATIIYQYIHTINPDAKVTYLLHDSKAHGLTEKILDQVAAYPYDLIIIPDAASNDEQQIARLYHMGMDILIIDHHEVEKISEFAILINNQLDWNEETNKNLVGAGMAYKFCQAMDKILGYSYADNFLDLVAIGQVGDISNISQNEIRNLVFSGLKNITNPFVKTVLDDRFGSGKKIAPKDLSTSIVPLINAVVRVGTMEEKQLLFRALNGIESDETFTVKKRKKNKKGGFDTYEVVQNLFEYAYDVCTKVKTRQDNLVKKTMKDLESNIDNSGGIAIGILKTSEEGSITGLVANKIVGMLQKPALLIYKVNGKYVGSGRGYEKTLPSLKDWCNDTGLVEFAQGHANAFGISIFEKDFEAFKEKIKEVEQQELAYEVDLWSHGKVDEEAITTVNKNKHLFGGMIHEPLFAFTGIKVNKQLIRSRGSVLTFFESGVEFVMYNTPKELYEKIEGIPGTHVVMDFVGRPGVSFYGGKNTPQLILSDFEIQEEVITVVTPKEVTAATLVF